MNATRGHLQTTCSTCGSDETCASCDADCGVCSVCGNNKYESSQFETCTNCPADCGECTVKNCLQVVTCTLGCIEFNTSPPKFSLTCVANCAAQGCPDVQYFVDEVVNCAIFNIQDIIGCPGSPLSCLQGSCGSEISACLGASCD